LTKELCGILFSNHKFDLKCINKEAKFCILTL
jgi:hypothetical protein